MRRYSVKYFIFECIHCDVNPVYMVDATDIVLCGSCFNLGTSQELTDEQVKELDLPSYEHTEIGDLDG